VALKILPPEFVEDKGWLCRFVREAKSASLPLLIMRSLICSKLTVISICQEKK
jgi:hypothetical protein